MQNRFTPEYIEHLAYKFKAGTLTAQENEDFESWYKLQAEMELNLSERDINNADELGAKLYENILNDLGLKPAQIQSRSSYNLLRILVAAAAVLIFGCVLFYYNSSQQTTDDNGLVSNDVAPGKAGAILTLANGRKIVIAEVKNGTIATQSGIKIKKSPDGQIIYEASEDAGRASGSNVISTSIGEQTRMRLADGSVVFLNAGSSLEFPASFVHRNQRLVKLSGEGYFEVVKDKDHPFVVVTDLQVIHVLGTRFNINSYKDEPEVRTTLLEGSIKLLTGGNARTLVPGEQAIVQKNKFEIREADTEEAIAWKNNEFFFKDDDFRTNMRKIARWYNVEVIYEHDAPNNFKLGGFLSKSRNLSAVLSLLENTEKVHFRVEGRKVYVRK